MWRWLSAVMMNVLVPGCGLVLLGRPWLGVALAVWFAVATEAVIVGRLIAPAAIPPGISAVGLVLAILGWVMAQGLLVTRIRRLCDPDLPIELDLLRSMAREAIDRQQWAEARSSLRLARFLNATDVETRILWAELLTRTSSPRRAERAWQQAARLARDPAHKRAVENGLVSWRSSLKC